MHAGNAQYGRVDGIQLPQNPLLVFRPKVRKLHPNLFAVRAQQQQPGIYAKHRNRQKEGASGLVKAEPE